jgi:VIT1/CCC1 family predicted Fe2+/Mn2+ transporter
MAAGEWLSVNSSREAFQREIDVVTQELRQVPDEQREELTLIYQAKGMSREQASLAASTIMQSEDAALDTLVREEFGIDPEQLGGSAWIAAVSSFLMFASGAILPVIPFLVFANPAATIASAALCGVALFVFGALTTARTGRKIWFSGLRQVAFGYAAAGITYSLGTALGGVPL